MKIAVLGGGLTGLTAAYYLTKTNHQVFLFERENILGGLASSFPSSGWAWPLERFYHHFFANDWEVKDLIKELGLEGKLFFKKPTTAIYYPHPSFPQYPNILISQFPRSPIHPFDSPLSLLTFPHLTLLEKLRTGAALAYLKLIPSWQQFDKLTAKNWLKRHLGKKPFRILWQPLLQAKFGNYADKVPMAWFWARIKKRTRSLGYLEGGFQTLINRLVEKIKENGGKILLNLAIQKITPIPSGSLCLTFTSTVSPGNILTHDRVSKSYIPEGIPDKFERIIATLPTPIFLKIFPALPPKFSQPLSQIDHLWAQTLILKMNKPFLKNTYWLNINDSSFPFLAVVEHTNFIDQSHYGGNHILYIGNYLPSGHPYLSKSPAELLQIFLPYLQRINPNFDHRFLIPDSQFLFSSPFAQPIFPPNYSQFLKQLSILNYQLLPGLYLANQDLVYPWDRGTNYSIELGKGIAETVIKDKANKPARPV